MDNETNQITEAQIASFIQAKARELSRMCGDEYARVGLSVRTFGEKSLSGFPDEIACEAYVHGGETQFSEGSMAKAMEAARRSVSPESKAAKIKAEAEKLVADAEKLLAEAAKLESSTN